jgi:hypothetical protein
MKALNEAEREEAEGYRRDAETASEQRPGSERDALADSPTAARIEKMPAYDEAMRRGWRVTWGAEDTPLGAHFWLAVVDTQGETLETGTPHPAAGPLLDDGPDPDVDWDAEAERLCESAIRRVQVRLERMERWRRRPWMRRLIDRLRGVGPDDLGA